MPLPYRSVLDAPIIRRVRVTPDRPDQLPQRAPGTRRPHGEAQVAAVRYLIEQTELTYSAIAKKTGVGRASICRWTVDNKWVRPVFAPRATDRVPRARASAKLRRRTLAARLDTLAQRYVTELESHPGVDLDKLAAALELAKMAKLAAMGRKRRRTPAREQQREAARELSPPFAPVKTGPRSHQHMKRGSSIGRHTNPRRSPRPPARRGHQLRPRTGGRGEGLHRQPSPAGERPALSPARRQVTAQAGAAADVGAGTGLV